MKGLIFLILLFVAVFIIENKFVSPTLQKADVCFNQEAEKIKEIKNYTEQLSSKDEQIEYFCREDGDSFNRITSCLRAVKSDNTLRGLLISLWPKYKNTLDNTVNSHNDMCPNSLINLFKIF